MVSTQCEICSDTKDRLVMDIAVLVKQVPKNTCAHMNSDHTVNRTGMGVINPNDLNALEVALRLKKQTNCKVTAITMGNASAKSVLKKAFALGVDQAVLVTDNDFIGSDTYATSVVLLRTLEYLGGYELILCGKQTMDGATAQVPAEIAGLLNVNYATGVMKCSFEGNVLQCERNMESGAKVECLTLPAVVSVSKDANVPRLPTPDGILQANSKDIRVLTNNELKLNTCLCGKNGSLTYVKKCISIQNNQERKNEYIGLNKFKELYGILTEQNGSSSKGSSVLHDIRNMVKSDKRTVMVFCEFSGAMLKTESIEVLNQACELALKLGANVSAITINAFNNCSEMLSNYGVVRNYALNIKDMYALPERVLSEKVLKTVEKENPQILLFSGTILGRGIAPYIAARLHSGLTADCTKLDIQEDDEALIQTRPAFGGKLYAVILSKDCSIQMATIKPNLLLKEYQIIGIQTELIEDEDGYADMECSTFSFLSDSYISFDEDVIIGIGNGIGSKQNCQVVKQYCEKRGFGFCATREVVDKGWVEHKYQVGLTGAIIAPKLYIALGISGAAEHIVGIQRSEIIVSVNSKMNESIFGSSDYCIVSDVNEFIDAFMNK